MEDLAGYLHEWALSYLSRFSTSREHLAKLMKRAAARRLARMGVEPAEELESMVEQTLDRLEELGLMGDRRYSLSRAECLQKRGQPLAVVRARLKSKGVGDEVIDEVLTEIRQAQPDSDLAAARLYARRRRLGPFRTTRDDDPKTLQRDLACLARRGFSFEVARQALEKSEDEPDD